MTDLPTQHDAPLGLHTLVDLFQCDELPQTPSDLQRHLEHAARLIGATVVESVFHQFNPHGLSGVVVIAESHLAIHTWPEHQTACVDFFTCGVNMPADPAIRYLAEAFVAKSHQVECLPRGRTRPLPT